MPLRNLISIPRFDSMLSKLLGIKERSIAPSVATELVPVLSLQDPAAGELYYTKGERLCTGCSLLDVWGTSSGAVQPVVNLGNPRGSNTLITIEAFQFYPAPEDQGGDAFSGAVKFDIQLGANYLGPASLLTNWVNTNAGCWRDTRWFTPANPGGNLGHVLEWYRASAAAATDALSGTIAWSGLSVVQSTDFSTQDAGIYSYTGKEIILAPGGFLQFIATWRLPTGSPGVTCKFDVQWRERPMEDSEIRAGSS